MSRSYLAIASAALVFGFATHAGATNVLSNPGFESGVLDPWFETALNFAGSPPGPDWSVSNSDPHSGTYAATVGDQFELEQTFAPVPTSAIGSLTFSAQGPSDPSTMAVYLFYSDAPEDDSNFVNLAGGFTWQSFDLASALLPGKNLDGIAFWGASNGTVQLDDVAVNAPEPMSLAMLGFSIFGLGIIRRGR